MRSHLESMRRPRARRITVTLSGSSAESCEYVDFRLGREYLVFAYANNPDAWFHLSLPETTFVTHLASPTRAVSDDLSRMTLDVFRRRH